MRVDAVFQLSIALFYYRYTTRNNWCRVKKKQKQKKPLQYQT